MSVPGGVAALYFEWKTGPALTESFAEFVARKRDEEPELWDDDSQAPGVD